MNRNELSYNLDHELEYNLDLIGLYLSFCKVPWDDFAVNWCNKNKVKWPELNSRSSNGHLLCYKIGSDHWGWHRHVFFFVVEMFILKWWSVIYFYFSVTENAYYRIFYLVSHLKLNMNLTLHGLTWSMSWNRLYLLSSFINGFVRVNCAWPSLT